MIVIDKETIARSLPYNALIEALRKAFSSETIAPERAHHTIRNAEGADATLLLMPAWKSGEHIGVKIASVFPDNGTRNMNAVQASYILMDASNGAPIAVMDGTELTLRRTACASALAADYLANKEPETLLTVGTGNLAPHLIKAHMEIRKYSKILIWGRDHGKAKKLARSLQTENAEIRAVEELRKATSIADVITCATLSKSPLISGDWLHPGQHLDLVGAFRPDMREVDSKALVISKIVVDTYEGSLSESGELISALKEGNITREHILSDLRELVLERKSIRDESHDITLFKSVGTALEDLAAAQLVMQGLEK